MLNLTLARERLRSQWIDPPMTAQAPEEVVAHMGGMQAQDYGQAVWAIGLRCGATLAQVEDALRARKIVRLWLMRGTIHFAPTHAVQAMLSVTRPRMLQAMAARLRELKLDAVTLDASSALLVNALRQHGELDRATLLRLLDEGGISPVGQRGYYMLNYAGIQGLIAMGIEMKKNPTYFALDALERAQPEAGLIALVTRFFASHGPAMLDDFVRWTGVTLGAARRGLALCGEMLTPPDEDGMIRGKSTDTPPADTNLTPQRLDTSTSRPPLRARRGDGGEVLNTAHVFDVRSGVHLLPGFDEYFIGYRDRGALLDPAHADKIVPGGNGIFKPMIVSDGEICGVWSREMKRPRVIITPAPFRALRDDERAGVEAAAARYGAFLGMAAEVKWG